VTRAMNHEDLMICGRKKNRLPIAGGHGRLNSEIKEDTTTVFLESALFSPTGNRRTSKRLGLETEGSLPFWQGN